MTTWIKTLARHAARALAPLAAVLLIIVGMEAVAFAAQAIPEDVGGIVEAIVVAGKAGGWLAVSALVVALIVRYGRPALQRYVTSHWPSAGWAGWAITALAAALVAGAEHVVADPSLSWTIVQVMVTTFMSIAMTPGMDSKTAEMQIFVKDISRIPAGTVREGTVDRPANDPPAGPQDPPADAGPT